MSFPVTTSLKVRLKTDLTHYHPRLTPGSVGYTIGVHGQCSRLSKKYTGVWFPGIRIVDVNWAALETIAEPQPVHSAKPESFKMARQVLKLIGL